MLYSKPKTVALIGAPWCEGQNLEGADLAPVAMREAGLSSAVKSLGLEFFDHGDIDFSHITPKSPHHYSVDVYRAWLKSGTSINFSTWMREDRAKQEDMRGSKRMRSPEAIPHLASTLGSTTGVNVVNAELMGSGLKLVYDQVKAALRPEAMQQGLQLKCLLTMGLSSCMLRTQAKALPPCALRYSTAHLTHRAPSPLR